MNSTERQIYLLNPREYSPEIIAVAFAKTSRSPESFRDIASDLNDEKSADFHEKWVVGYGHSSVAEHAVLHMAFENVSRLAVETIESNRLASYTEKSTRYQKWTAGAYYTPFEVTQTGLEKEYRKLTGMLFETYARSLELCKVIVQGENPRKVEETEAIWERRIRSEYVDVCRFLLPAASLANLGMTANARVLEGMIRKMLSHPLDEVRAIGSQVKKVAVKEVPTLLKYADAMPYLVDTPALLSMDAQSVGLKAGRSSDWCTLLNWQPDGEDELIAAALFRFSGGSYEDALSRVKQFSPEQKQQVFEHLLGGLGKFDTPLRELEHITYTFAIVMDQGGYFEVKRHRMMTQTVQPLTSRLGYTIPVKVMQAGFYDDYCRAMDSVCEGYQRLEPALAEAVSYLIPNAFNRRVLLSMNFREAFNFCALRSASNAHFSVRRVARRVAEEIQKVHPMLGRYIQVSADETWQSVERDYFLQV